MLAGPDSLKLEKKMKVMPEKRLRRQRGDTLASQRWLFPDTQDFLDRLCDVSETLKEYAFFLREVLQVQDASRLRSILMSIKATFLDLEEPDASDLCESLFNDLKVPTFNAAQYSELALFVENTAAKLASEGLSFRRKVTR